ncbi:MULTISPECIES: hypothetical protein [Bacillales]|uniref:hypothetical protein n=1 Tax=Bacillales TaxID=1385 RepID=UPI0003489011|nr:MULTISPECIES: hypothetical protein [Bacillales]KMZ42643.1 hypothetical protein AC624_16815 [Bacillus sp. FJAT-27238]
MMTREQAIFLETMDDVGFEGYTEFLIFAYHELISGMELTSASDVEVHRRAKAVILKYQDYWYKDVNFFDERYKILEQLDLDDAEWEYIDYE